MKNIAFVFRVHQPFRLRKYRFFDIGGTHDYYDDYQNKYALKRFAEQSYNKANTMMKRLLSAYSKDFCFSFAFSGTAIDQMQWYYPELLSDFQDIVSNKGVELLSEPYSSSLASLLSKECFCEQVKEHKQRINEVFKKTPKVLVNTDLIYGDEIGEWASEMKFKGMLIEGAKHILGWKSPNYIYANPNTKLPLILRNPVLSENISLRFSDRDNGNWPYTVERMFDIINSEEGDSNITLFMDYAVFGEFQPEESGIFAFFEALVKYVSENENYSFVTPSTLCDKEKVADLHVPTIISCVDEERDLSACYGNDLQRDVVGNWRKIWPIVHKSKDMEIKKDFTYLIGSDHLHFMSTKWFSNEPSPRYIRPYDNAYDGYINYMNVLSDFMQRIGAYEQECRTLQTSSEPKKPAAKKPAAKKTTATKKVASKASKTEGKTKTEKSIKTTKQTK